MFVTYFSCNVFLLLRLSIFDGSELFGVGLSPCPDFTKLLNVVVVKRPGLLLLFPETIEHVAVCGLHEWITQTVL